MTIFTYEGVSDLHREASHLAVPTGAFFYHTYYDRLYLNLGTPEQEELYRFPQTDGYRETGDTFQIRRDKPFISKDVVVVNCEFAMSMQGESLPLWYPRRQSAYYDAHNRSVSLPLKGHKEETDSSSCRLVVSTSGALPEKITVTDDDYFSDPTMQQVKSIIIKISKAMP
jgi:hypothetical protein